MDATALTQASPLREYHILASRGFTVSLTGSLDLTAIYIHTEKTGGKIVKIMGMGLDLSGQALFKTMEENAVAKGLLSKMEVNAKDIASLTRTTTEAVSYRGEVARVLIDPGDPRAAGWTYLVNSADPKLDRLKEILKPLAAHRSMSAPLKPLLYKGEPSDEWFTWLHDNYYAMELEGEKVPQYILIVGGPEQVPFRFQSILDAVANVGRVDFDTLDDLKHYVDKVIRIETAQEPVVTDEAVLFAPDGGLSDPTYFSREYMVKPLAGHIKDELGFKVHAITGDDATKGNLLVAMSAKKPALIYTASHGLGAMNEPFETQKRLNGAICCQHAGALTMDAILSAEDIPLNKPFLEGSVFFQFACFGYGTPAQSDYTHWLKGMPEKYTEKDFTAALPKRLLAHPRGPIAFIGHLDTAFLHGFADAEEPHTLDRWHTRISPFVHAVNKLLQVQPPGLAMNDMNTRYSVCNALITNTYDRQRRGTLNWTETLERRFLDNWITRSDAQNYMILGDPAACLRIHKE